MVFAQGTGKVTTSTERPVNALHTYIKTTSSTQSANSEGIYGLDSTRYIGTPSGTGVYRLGSLKVGSGNFNIASGDILYQSGFIRFEDSDVDTTATVPGFKFHIGDTIFLALQSHYSATFNPARNYRAKNRFSFGNVNLATGNATNTNNNIGYNLQGNGAHSMSFHIIDGTVNGFPGAITTTSNGRVGAAVGDSNVVRIVIDSTHAFLNSTKAQLSLTDVFLRTTGRWLQGATECYDTLLVSYGRGPMWNQSLPIMIPNPARNVENGGWASTSAGAVLISVNGRNLEDGAWIFDPDPTAVTPQVDDDNLTNADLAVLIGAGAGAKLYEVGTDTKDAMLTADRFHRLIYVDGPTIYSSISNARYTPFPDDIMKADVASGTDYGGINGGFWAMIIDSSINYAANPQVNSSNDDIPGWLLKKMFWVPDGPSVDTTWIINVNDKVKASAHPCAINDVDIAGFASAHNSYPSIASGIVNSVHGAFYYYTDSTINHALINGGWIGGRAPVTVRRGGHYWTFEQGVGSHFDNNFTTVSAAGVPTEADQYVGGAPILLLTLLPGDPAFVRWNVGFGPSHDALGVAIPMPAGKIRPDGRLQPTIRRINARGKVIAAGGPITNNLQPFDITDTVTAWRETTLGGTWHKDPDTLFVFDADSNIVNDNKTAALLIGVDSSQWDNSSSGSTYITDLSICFNAYGVRKYDTLYQPGRRVYNWGFDISNDARLDRIRKIRLIGVIPEAGQPVTNPLPPYYYRKADTLNSAFVEATDLNNGVATPCFSANGLESRNNIITIAPGPVSSMSVQYQAPSSTEWQSFVAGGININSATAKAPGHKLQATLRDRCGNVIYEAAVGFNAFAGSTELDTVINGITANRGAGRFVEGNITPGRPTPTLDTLFLFARASAEADDRGVVQAQFNTACNNDVVYFAFTAYRDSINAAGQSIVTGYNNRPVLTLGGMGDNTYKLNISGSTDAANIMLSNSANGFVRVNPWPIPDTAIISARSSCKTDTIEFRIQAIDNCGHWLKFTDVNQVKFSPPDFIGGGWGTVRSQGRPAGFTATYESGRTVVGQTWGLTLEERQGTGTDSVGKFIPSNTTIDRRIDANGYLYVKYVPPDIARDTLRILAQVVGSPLPPDTNIIATISTPPSSFKLSMRPTRFGDTALVASRGATVDREKTTFAYGVLRDCNSELVSPEYDKYTRVFWRLEGTSRWSAFLFDPTIVYSPSGMAGDLIDLSIAEFTNVPFGKFHNHSIQQFRGVRQWVGGINSTTGKAFVGINSDTVGGSRTVSGSLVFPLERRNVFPTTAYDENSDSVKSTYAWDGTDNSWNRALGLDENNNTIYLNPIVASKNPTWPGVATLANGATERYNLRGYNELTATAYFIDTTVIPIKVKPLNITNDTTSTLRRGYARYQVFADKPNQVAWIDGTGDYFDSPNTNSSYQLPGLDYLNLYGRQAAEIVKQEAMPSIITTRKVIAETNKQEPGVGDFPYFSNVGGFTGIKENSWRGGRSYAGRVVPLYARMYDVFGNPANDDAATTLSKTVITKGNNLTNPTWDTTMAIFGDYGYGTTDKTDIHSRDTVYYNQYFVGGSNNAVGVSNAWTAGQTNTAKVGARAARTWFISYGRLRGAVGVEYQTLSHKGIYGGTAGSNTFGMNIGDIQRIAVTVEGITLGDTALVYSKPTGLLAQFRVESLDTLINRVGRPNIIDWSAWDYAAGEYPEYARLMWWDHRLGPHTKVTVATDNISDAPIKTLYGISTGSDHGILPLPSDQQFTGHAEIGRQDAETNYDATNPDKGWFDITYFNKEDNKVWTDNLTGKTFASQQYSNPVYSVLYSSYLGGPLNITGYTTPIATGAYNRYGWGTNAGGFLGGIARTRFTAVKSDVFDYAIIDSATQKVMASLPKKLSVLPGYIHWVAMGNPDAVIPEREALHPYPLRRSIATYETVTVQFPAVYNPVAGLTDPWNEASKGTYPEKDPRSYSPPVDTVFIGEVYNLELRTYDRWGNRNTIDSVYVSMERLQGFWTTNVGSPGNEFLLDQDTTRKTVEQVCDIIKMVPTELNRGAFSDKIRINYNTMGSTLNNVVRNKPDLTGRGVGSLGAQIVAFRDVYVKSLQKPGEFSITSKTKVLLDDGNFVPTWTKSANTNLSDDSIRYTIYFRTLNDVTIWMTEAVKGLDYTLTPELMAQKFDLGPGHYNRDLKWYVEAKNKWGLTTASTNTMTTTFELNKKPEAFKLKAVSGLVNNTKIVNSTATPLTLEWNTPIDSNGSNDGAVQTKIMSWGKEYMEDWLDYKVVFTKTEEFPAGNTAPNTWETIVSIGNAETISLDTLKMLLGNADNVTYTWQVFAKDRPARGWDVDSFVTASDKQTIVLTKIGTFAKVMVNAAQNSTNSLYKFPATDSVIFVLTAMDGEDNIIRGFNAMGVNLKLETLGATAGKSQKQFITLSVGGKVLAGDIVNGYVLPSSYFVNGQASVTYKNTKANEVVQISIPDNNPSYKLIDSDGTGILLIKGDKTRQYMTTPGPIVTLAVEVKPRKGTDIVYVKRAMEVVVTPSDIYDNEVINLDNAIGIGLSARYPDEFLESAFSGVRHIMGRVNYILTPQRARDDQYIDAFLWDNHGVIGRSQPFRILTHAPSAFTLDYPADKSQINLQTHNQEQYFRWNPASDPHDTKLITTVPLENGKVVPDTIDDVDYVTYALKIEESAIFQLAGMYTATTPLVAFRTNGTSLYNLTISLGYGDAEKDCIVHWYVEATDGLYITKSNVREVNVKPMGIVEVDEKVNFIPETFALGQNYPNPFNPTTTIQYDIAKATDVKIVIYNILGQPVRTLVNARQEAARYNAIWDGKNDQGATVATGTYIYQIKAGEFSATKKMNLLK